MNNSLREVVTDENGYFHHPNGYPLVVIFDSKHGKEKKNDKLSWQEPVIGQQIHDPDDGAVISHEFPFVVALITRIGATAVKPKKKRDSPLKFVNVSRPVKGGRRGRKVTRTLAKSTNVECVSMDDAATSNAMHGFDAMRSGFLVDSISRLSFPALDPFGRLPVFVEPYMGTLLHRCKFHGSIFAHSLYCVYPSPK